VSEARLEDIKRYSVPTSDNLMWEHDGRRVVSAYVDDIEWLIAALEEARRKNELLLDACERLLGVHGPERGDYVEAVMHMSRVVEDVKGGTIHPIT
jgi:hypothetical protein